MIREAYRRAGVDVAAGDRAIELMRARLTALGADQGAGAGAGVEVVGGLGGFGAAVALPDGRDQLLVAGADGVGTKTAIAERLGRYDTVGQDVVAYNIDDVVCHGARPLFLLDYLAVGRVVPEVVAEIVAGVGRACAAAGCALVGGETAEHPGLMDPEQFDLAGFCVGLVAREDYLDGRSAQAGDVLVGLAAGGLRATGYSLVRAVLAEHELALEVPYAALVGERLGGAALERLAIEEPEHERATLGDVLLEPSRVYTPDVLALRAALRAAGHDLHGLAHVTGGGLPGNVPRALPEELAAEVRTGTWPVPAIHRLLATLAGLDGAEARATFNGGLGMVAVVPEAAADLAVAALGQGGVPAWPIGRVVASDEGPRYREVA
ncbi:MAG TPA: phosphoribosylformylglycinamidine cyclo-ligase [Candidatus Limnocylindrales bacterium]|nr:phosphoribosylformylglycinamidine cyclo-ligase [Candidatus Limnocylindrales bacterium]